MKPCDLCALPVGNEPFRLETEGKVLEFCCEGCRGIYQMIHDLHSERLSTQNDRVSPTDANTRRTP
ncbi:MAG: heavy metal translocating P-type ATPase metal-binding domain-containing protein [Rhodocyclaceae bacterium]|nr:heavy metal translocating P-type ATPase metal-binding domain-containing protein [Rhodocyclaceae bacterium]